MGTEKLVFNLTVDQTNIILSALQELPYKQVSDIIQYITTEGGRQINEAQSAASMEAIQPKMEVVADENSENEITNK